MIWEFSHKKSPIVYFRALHDIVNKSHTSIPGENHTQRAPNVNLLVHSCPLVVSTKSALCTDGSPSGVLQGLVASRSQERRWARPWGAAGGREIEEDTDASLSSGRLHAVELQWQAGTALALRQTCRPTENTRGPRENLHRYAHLILDKGAK